MSFHHCAFSSLTTAILLTDEHKRVIQERQRFLREREQSQSISTDRSHNIHSGLVIHIEF
jgi:hypothetical protein